MIHRDQVDKSAGNLSAPNSYLTSIDCRYRPRPAEIHFFTHLAVQSSTQLLANFA
jgi:hypothetical protein